MTSNWDRLPAELQEEILQWRIRLALALVHKELLYVVPTAEPCLTDGHLLLDGWGKWSRFHHNTNDTRFNLWGLAVPGYQDMVGMSRAHKVTQAGANTNMQFQKNNSYRCLFFSGFTHPLLKVAWRDVCYFTDRFRYVPRDYWGDLLPLCRDDDVLFD